MEKYFKKYRENTIGWDKKFNTPYGTKPLIYADWIASGRLYKPIEDRIKNEIGPYVANTHTETNESGTLMTKAYHYATRKIKKHVNAGPEDVIIMAGTGMTSVINKLHRIMGLRFSKVENTKHLSERPVVFITHLEHHSNHTSWYETICDVVVVPPGEGLVVDPENLRIELEKYKDRKLKIGSFSACSNVTGVRTPYYELAKIMHDYGGLCFVDFAASAPYEKIDMHPEDESKKLDAIFFSPHKFLGGPGTTGAMIFDSKIYNSEVPDNSGGGTVDWTNAWGEYKYVDDIEMREDGGTPGFLQAIRAAMAIDVKEKMGCENIEKREKQLLKRAFVGLREIPNVRILADNIEDRLGVISFYIEGVHYNLVVKVLNDRFGIQVRGGCACAGTYGHYLLDVTHEHSQSITDKIDGGDLSEKPGWVRLSLHPTMTDEELEVVLHAVKEIAEKHKEWACDYIYNKKTNEYRHISESEDKTNMIKSWFDM